jgi:glycosyltransferase involved in cell wall biosynthesis
MKVLIINYRFLHTGGPERYMFNVIAELEKRGHEIINFSVKNKNNIKSKYEPYFANNIDDSDNYLYKDFKKGFKFYVNSFSREFYSFSVKNKLEKLIKDTRPDVCYLLPHKGALSPSVIDALKKYNIPIVHRISDYNIICPQAGLYRDRMFCDKCKQSRFNVVRHKCIKGSLLLSTVKYLSSSIHYALGLYKKVDYFVTTNKFAEEKFAEFNFNKDKLITVNTFSPISVVSKPANYVPSVIKFICVGNIDDSKGTYDLIEAVDQLVKKHQKTNFTLEIIGGLHASERLQTENLIQSKNLQAFVSVKKPVGFQELKEIYKTADISILPSRWVENLPNVQIESLAHSVPVVVPDFGSFAATLDTSVAYFFQHHNVASLAETLNYIVTSPETISSKTTACNDFVEMMFNKDKHVDRLLTIFNTLINENI